MITRYTTLTIVMITIHTQYYYFSEGHFFKFAGCEYKNSINFTKIKPKLYNDSELENAWHCSITLRFDSENDKAPL